MTALWHLLQPYVVVHQLGGDGSAGSRSADDLLEVVCTRRLDERPFPLVQLDTSYVKSRFEGSVVYETVVTATGIDRDGEAEPLGLSFGDGENPLFWAKFLLSMRVRGLHGVERVLSEEHTGIEDAVVAVFPDAEHESAGQPPVLAVVVDDASAPPQPETLGGRQRA